MIGSVRSAPARREGQVQVLYVIPKGQKAKPDAAKALAAIMAVVQRYYYQQLGVTFELRTPLVSVVPINESVEQLKDQAMYQRAQRLATTEFKRDYEYRENVIVAVFEGLDIGLGLGGDNIATISSSFWVPPYDMFRRAPSDVPKADGIGAFPHELGHGFGLAHTEDTKKCFKKFDVDLGPLPNLIMQQTGRAPSVYDYTFLPEEKRLLLREPYFPACKSFGDRPPAGVFLRHPLPAEPK